MRIEPHKFLVRVLETGGTGAGSPAPGLVAAYGDIAAPLLIRGAAWLRIQGDDVRSMRDGGR